MRDAETIDKNKRKHKLFSKLAETLTGTEHEQWKELVPALLNSSLSVFYVVQDGKFQVVAPQLLKLTNFSQQELLGRNSLSIVHPDDRATVRENAVKMLKCERSEPYEFRALDKAGNIHYVMEAVTSITYKGKLAALGNWVELTERKQAEGRHKTIVKTALDGFWLTNLEGKLLEVNDSYCQMTGYTREELIKMSIQDIEEVENPEETARHIEKIAEQVCDRFETRHKCKDGRIIDVEISVNYFDAEEGQLFVFARDITERKRIGDSLRESEEFGTNLMQNAPNPIEVINPDTSIKYVNPAFEKLTGFTLAEVVGRKAPHPWWSKEAKEEISASLKEAMALGGRREERILQKRNGECSCVVLNSAPVMHNSTLKYFLVNWVDITKLKQVEETLRESEEKYRDLLDNTNELIQSVTPEGRFRYVNKAWRQALGYTEKELADLSIFDIIHPDCVKDYKILFQKIKSGENIGPVNTTFVSRTGIKIIVEGSVTRKFANGELLYTRGIFRDITKNKYLEEQMFRLSSAISMSTDCIVITDFEAKIIDVNKKTLEIYGADSKGELIGRHFLELIAPSERAMVSKDVGEIMAKGYLECRKYNLISKHGHEFPVQMSTSLVRAADGEPMGMVRVGRELNNHN